MSTLREDIEATINRHHRENESGTPDFILAEYLLAALASVEATIKARDKWWGFEPHLGGKIPAYGDGPGLSPHSDADDQ